MKGEKYFKRIELKYLINSSQQKYLLDEMKRYMKEDEFGKSVVNSLYFDTPDFYLIRNSLQKPAYKEKIRIRSYGRANHETKVFIELKKKYKSVVYKRKVRLREGEAMDYSGVFDDIFEKYAKGVQLLNVKTTDMGSMFRMTYNLKLKDIKKEKEFVDELRCRNGNMEIFLSRQEMSSEL